MHVCVLITYPKYVLIYTKFTVVQQQRWQMVTFSNVLHWSKHTGMGLGYLQITAWLKLSYEKLKFPGKTAKLPGHLSLQLIII